MKIKCFNCRLETDFDFPIDNCLRCWEVINFKKHNDYIFAKKILKNYGMTSGEAKKALENVLTSADCNITMATDVLVKLAFAQQLEE